MPLCEDAVFVVRLPTDTSELERGIAGAEGWIDYQGHAVRKRHALPTRGVRRFELLSSSRRACSKVSEILYSSARVPALRLLNAVLISVNF